MSTRYRDYPTIWVSLTYILFFAIFGVVTFYYGFHAAPFMAFMGTAQPVAWILIELGYPCKPKGKE